jgi:hypothetical protein
MSVSSRNSTRTRRIFGGAEPAGEGEAAYARPLMNPADQAVAETLPVGTTYRVFPGPKNGGVAWSYHINRVSAAGAASELTFWYSNLPNPDPATAAHWVDSGIVAIDLTSTADLHATVEKAPTWIMAKAVVAVSTGTLWAYVRCTNVDE